MEKPYPESGAAQKHLGRALYGSFNYFSRRIRNEGPIHLEGSGRANKWKASTLLRGPTRVERRNWVACFPLSYAFAKERWKDPKNLRLKMIVLSGSQPQYKLEANVARVTPHFLVN